MVVVDNGMDHRHEDLSPNLNRSLNHDYSGGGDIHDPEYHHGTVVAGVVAARDNNIGVRGVAPRATIYGYNFLAAQSSFSEADSMTRNRDVTAVSNNSWGPVDVLGFVESFWEAAVMKGTPGGLRRKRDLLRLRSGQRRPGWRRRQPGRIRQLLRGHIRLRG